MDVAKAAGVSQALVSLVLSGAPIDVAETTRARILAEAQRLGYARKPQNPIRQRLLAYIRPVVTRGHHQEEWIYDAYEQLYDRFQTELVEQAYQAGYSLMVRPCCDPLELTLWLSQWGFDGVIWHGADPHLAQWIARRYPMVQLNRLTTPEADAVMPHQEELVTLPLDYLRAKGHSRILFLPAQPLSDPLRKAHNRAYRDYMKQYGFPDYRELFPQQRDLSVDEMQEALWRAVKLPPARRPTALIAGSHQVLRFMKQAEAEGYSNVFSMIGIDNVSATAYSTPALTTIDTRPEEVARLAVSLLADRIRDPGRAIQKILVSPLLVERQSVHPVPATSNP